MSFPPVLPQPKHVAGRNPAQPPAPHHAATRPPRSAWSRVRSWVTTVVLVLVSLLALLTVVIPFVLGAETYTVLTGSMRPGLEPGALVAVRDTDVEDIRVGDVVTYQLRPGEPAVVTHRVVGVQKGRGDDDVELLTRGDANNTVDPVVLPVQVRGVVVYAVPWLGYPNLLVSGTARSSMVVVLGAAVVGYGFIVLAADLLRGRRRKTPHEGAELP